MNKDELVKAMLAIYIMGHSQDPDVGVSKIDPNVIISNRIREENGLPKLIQKNKLEQSALTKSQNINANNDFQHISSDGTTPWNLVNDTGYKYQYAGENLARGYDDPEKVYRAWMDSPIHKKVILNPNYTETGTGTSGPYTTQHFATPTKEKKPTVWDLLTGKLK
jgi:uncharacterized protein YkwD